MTDQPENPKLARARRALEAELCRRSAHHFIFASKHLVTKDEHDAKNPVKPVPDLPYLRALLDCYLVSGRLMAPEDARHALAAGLPLAFLIHLHSSGLLFIEKSRDMFVTNLTCCYVHWRARSIDHQLILVQSKNEEDAAKLVYIKEPQFGRISFMEDHLPAHLRTMAWPKSGAYANLYLKNGSHIRGIPEGGHIIRSEHPSLIVSDEAAFQPEFGDSFTAAMPAVEGGGQYLAISSAEPGEFESLVDAETGTNLPTKIPGLSWRLAGAGNPVLRVHYAADPAKRPGTPEGDAWRERAAARVGGIKSARWRKELEIEYRALGGTKVFGEWDQWQANGKIVIPMYRASAKRLFASYDHGWTNPAAFHVHAIDGDGNIDTVWEFYADKVPVKFIADIIKGQSVVVPGRDSATIEPDRMRFEGNPYAEETTWRLADPSIWSEDQAMSDNTMKSIAYLFQRAGVIFQKGERGGDTAVVEWLLGHFWADPSSPRYRITQNCPWLIWELGQQRYKQLSAQVALNSNAPEVLVDKHNHAWDCHLPDTDILTERGWMPLPDVQETDRVAVWSDGALLYETPLAVVAKRHVGDIYVHETQTANFAVTPTHNMLVARRRGDPYALVPITAIESIAWSPRTVRWQGKDVDSPIDGVSADDVLAWFGFWLAEGCKSTNNRGSYYAHVDQKNPDAELLALVHRLGRHSRRDNNGVTRFTLGKLWHQLVADQGRSYEKHIPEWIKSASARQLSILLHWMWKGDGSGARYKTASRQLADDVQECILKCGGMARIGVQKERESVMPRGGRVRGRALYYVDRHAGHKGSQCAQIRPDRITRRHYDGMVHCVSTRAGVVLTRRNGVTLWSGNSLKMFLKRFPPAMVTPKPEQKGATFMWWRKQAQNATKGGTVATYRREMTG